MRVLVVGLHHEIQFEALPDGTLYDSGRQAHARQSPAFKFWLSQAAQRMNASLIAEEMKHGVPTIAQSVSRALKIDCRNIDMTVEERDRLGIPRGYWELRAFYGMKKVLQWHRQREDFMFNAFCKAVGGIDSALLLCGRLHHRGLIVRLRKASWEATYYDMRREHWYTEWG